MSQPANIQWDNNPEIWNLTSYIWGIFETITTSGGPAELTPLQREQFKSLKQSDKNRLVTLYVEVFKDYLDPDARMLAERAGIRLKSISKKEIRENISVSAIEQSLTKHAEIHNGKTEIITRPKISITALFEILDIKQDK
jgi:hypothetical protein